MGDTVAYNGQLCDASTPIGEFLLSSIMAVLDNEGPAGVSEFVVAYKGATVQFKLTAMGFRSPMFHIDKEVQEARPSVN